jgi:hypothetical protein
MRAALSNDTFDDFLIGFYNKQGLEVPELDY